MPARVVVSEYVDVANAFVDRDETGMVNAVLDQLARQLRAGEFDAAAGERRGAKRATMQSGEDRLIARYFKPLARHPGAFGLIDDAAVLTPPPGHDLVLKTDAIVGGVHFFPTIRADAVARKALRVNLSDLAAKGAKPAGFLLSLALPEGIDDALARGLRRAASARTPKRYGCPLLGGDTDRTPGPVTISIAAFGTLPQGTMVRRSGARVGDRVVVTGTIGDAALGLQAAARPRRGTALAARRRRCAAISPRAICVPRAAQRAGRGVARAMPRPRWTCPTGSSAISASSAAPPASAPRSRSRACRCRSAAQAALAAEPDADRDRCSPAATTTRSLRPCRAGELDAFRAAARAAGVPVTEIGRVVGGERRRASTGRTASRSPSRAPRSAIFEAAARCAL